MTSETRTAGDVLDAKVAQKVFGLPAIPWDHATRCPECGDEMRYCGARSRCSTCNEWRTSPYREYSGEIAAAWTVVEKMRERGWFLTLKVFPPEMPMWLQGDGSEYGGGESDRPIKGTEGRTFAQFLWLRVATDEDVRRRLRSVRPTIEQTVPRAITLAALAALEAEATP